MRVMTHLHPARTARGLDRVRRGQRSTPPRGHRPGAGWQSDAHARSASASVRRLVAETRLHRPDAEIWVGVRTEGTEIPARVDRIIEAVSAQGLELLEAEPHADDAILDVHDADFVEHLATVHETWLASGIPELVGQDRVVPYMFATPAMRGSLPARRPTAVHALAGWYCYDTMTLVGPGTWPAVRAAVDCALTAADLVASGHRMAYAVCRPPGHHATRNGYGGSCYLNNAAITAQALRRRATTGSLWSTSTRTTATGRHRSSTTASRRPVRVGTHRSRRGLVPPCRGVRRRERLRRGVGTTLNVPLQPETGDKGGSTRWSVLPLPPSVMGRPLWLSRWASTLPPTTPSHRSGSPATGTLGGTDPRRPRAAHGRGAGGGLPPGLARRLGRRLLAAVHGRAGR